MEAFLLFCQIFVSALNDLDIEKNIKDNKSIGSDIATYIFIYFMIAFAYVCPFMTTFKNVKSHKMLELDVFEMIFHFCSIII